MNSDFQKIRSESLKRLLDLKDELEKAYCRNPEIRDVCIYACGSLGRLEMTEKSDLDVFFITTKDNEEQAIPNLDKYLFFAEFYRINKMFHYKDPSKKGAYWEFTSKANLLDIGSRQEDYNNSFTARMLLILESKPLYNETEYNKLIEDVISKYYADYDEHSGSGFYPLFLMNDILRYWYTLTLNYEYRRDKKDDVNKKYWKRLKLKYARLITCYSMLACLYKVDPSPDYVVECIKKTPFERLFMLSKDNKDIKDIVSRIETEYEWFLNLRNENSDWWQIEDNKQKAFERADDFHNLVVHNFMKTISLSNPVLRNKADIY